MSASIIVEKAHKAVGAEVRWYRGLNNPNFVFTVKLFIKICLEKYETSGGKNLVKVIIALFRQFEYKWDPNAHSLSCVCSLHSLYYLVNVILCHKA